MRNPLAALATVARPRALAPAQQAHPPVAYASGRQSAFATRDDRTAQLGAMAATGTSFAVIDLLANSTAQVGWGMYTIPTSGLEEDRVPVTQHAALDLVDRPNPFMTRQYLMEAVQQHYESCGEGAIVLYKVGSLPIEMWPCRPDRLSPVPSPTKFLTGWVYAGPDGEKVPLAVDEILWLRTPNPQDPYRGLGPFGALTADLESTQYAAQWNRNFFTNGAEPGGIIEIAESLDQDEFDEKRARWQEQHRGVAAAHRVAILEAGMKWVTTGITQKDMQFVELRKVSRDTIMEAKRVHGHMLGIAEDVNLANAQAADATFARWQSVPRLERWKQLFNVQLLPMFGGTATGREFDYDNPVPEDRETENATLTAKCLAWAALVEKGADPASAAQIVGLPEIEMAEVAAPAPVSPQLMPAPDPDEEDPEEPVAARAVRLDVPRPRAQVEGPDDVDVTALQDTWQALLASLMAEWGPVAERQHADLLDQITKAVNAGDLAALTDLKVDSAEADALLRGYLDRMAADAAGQVVLEAQTQGVDGVDPVLPAGKELDDLSMVTAALMASSLATSAGREAMRVQSAGARGVDVADQVRVFLREMSDAGPKSAMGGALTGAQNSARAETFRSAPVAALYANEKLDSNTCKNCREIDGRFIGLSPDAATTAEVARMYPMGGYVDCLGRDRCRGTIVGIWRPQQAGGER